jgi:hypothetical protein
MSHKTSPQRRAAFFQALRETGNQTIAAERAKVSSSWVQLHRVTDPEFKSDVAEAVAEARESLSWAADQARGARGSCKPPRGWGHLDGEELVVKGSGGSGGGRRVQIARARLKQWTPRIEDRFLATLAATCNVKAACAEVGFTQASAYGHRKRWPAFATRWDEAIADGYARIEAALVENGCNLFSTPEVPPEAAMPPMTVAEAIQLLHMHKHQVLGLGKAPGKRRRPPPTLAEMKPGILRKFEAFERARALSEAGKARSARDYARRRRSE